MTTTTDRLAARYADTLTASIRQLVAALNGDDAALTAVLDDHGYENDVHGDALHTILAEYPLDLTDDEDGFELVLTVGGPDARIYRDHRGTHLVVSWDEKVERTDDSFDVLVDYYRG